MSAPGQLNLFLDSQPRSVEDQVHAFGTNLIVRAGAGTGKTEQLTSLYVHLVAGATELGRPVSPERIVAVTFTEKAAGEMRERIGAVLRHLARPDADDDEPPRIASVLRRSLEARGRPFDPMVFRAALEALPGARIKTLHAFAGGLLRAHAIQAGLDPSFEVLEETAAAELLSEVAVGAVRQRLEADDEAVATLVQELGGLFAAGRGLVPRLSRLHAELVESGQPASALLTGTPYVDAGYDRALSSACGMLGVRPADARLGKVGAAFETLAGVHERVADEPGLTRGERSGLADAAQAAAELRREASFGADDVEALAAAVRVLDLSLRTAAGAKSKAWRVEECRAVREAALELWALPRRRARAEAILALLADTERRFRREKARLGVLDFSDLGRRARDLLRDHPALRREVVDGMDALMVDEFQDTNAIQRDLVYLLHARDAVGKSVPRRAQLRSRGLFVVGDRKQSIYGFRNADVAVFEAVAADIVAEGGRELSLSKSYRSVAPLVEAINVLSRAALTAAPGSTAARPARADAEEAESAEEDAGVERPKAFEITFEDSEVLEPVHSAVSESAPVELITIEDGGVEEEARALAAHLAASLDAGCFRVRDSAGVRAGRPGDVAILLPRFTHVLTYLRALEDLGLPFVVVKGRGLMQTVEARDVLALSRVLIGDDDGRNLAAVLRGPMVAVSDPALLTLARSTKGGLRRLLDEHPGPTAEMGPGTAARFERAVSLLRRLRAGIDRLGLGTALELALAETGYAAITAGLPAGLQRMANIDRLVAEVVARERSGEAGRAIVQDLVRRSSEAGDREADVATENADAIRVMTVHQSKGLQFPIVVAADLGRAMRVDKSSVEHDRHPEAGLAVAVRAPFGDWLYAPHHERVHAMREKRERAERLRLFYVQITRARDHLILVGQRTRGSVMLGVVDSAIPELVERGLLARVGEGSEEEDASPDAGKRSAPEPTGSTLGAEAIARLSRRAVRARPHVAELEVPVTQVEDFALCPRRFRARHVVRLPEHPEPRAPASPEVDEDLGADPRRRGTLAHAVLEHLDFQRAAGEPSRALSFAMEEAGAPASADLLRRLTPFVGGEYAQRVGALDARAVTRELPFTLAVDAGPAKLLLKGQIDLLVDFGDAVDVVDYKVTSPRSGADPTAPYHFQLGAYAAAVRRGLGDGRAVRPAIQFLDGKAHLPVVAAVPDLEPRLPALGEALLEARRSGEYEGREESTCRAIHCGYRWLCHPDS